MPTLKQLIYRHPTHKKWAKHWTTLSALAEGGCSVDKEIKARLLINPDGAETGIMSERLRLAPYDSIIGSIIMKLVSQLMRDESAYEGSSDAYWEEFRAHGSLLNNEGIPRRESFHSFLAKAIYTALVQGAMIAQVDDVGDAMKPYVILRNREDLWDWHGDKEGLVYAKLHSYRYTKLAWDATPVREHQFTIYQRDERGAIAASIYSLKHRNDKEGVETLPPFGIDDLETLSEANVIIEDVQVNVPIFSTSSGEFRFPVVIRAIEKPLQIADQLYDHMVSLFNHTAGGEWALIQTNYGVLKFTGVDKAHQEGNNNPAKMVQQGNGYYMECEPGVDAEWLVRPGNDIQLTLAYQETLKAKMLELINKIAETASNAYAMRMQSGESKKEQRRDLDILLEVYGESIRGFAADVLNVASIARNEYIEWGVEGFTDYNTDGLSEYIQDYVNLDQSGIDSPTLKRESQKAIASKAIEKLNLQPSIMKEVSEEISESPFNLTPEMARLLLDASELQELSSESLLINLQKAGYLYPEMDLEAELARQNVQSAQQDLSQIADETILSDVATNEQQT